MRRLALLVMLLLATANTAAGAITERYVTTTGALAHDGTDEANAYSWAEMVTAINGGAAAGYRYNVKSGTYSLSATTNITVSGTRASPLVIRGYKTTIGDLDEQGRTSGGGALNTNDFPDITYGSTYRLVAGGDYTVVLNLDVSGTVSNNLVEVYYAANIVRHCRIANSSTGGAACAMLTNFAVDIDASIGASGGDAVIYADHALYNRITTSPAAGIKIYGTAAIGNVVSGCATVGISYIGGTGGQFICIGNTVHNCTNYGIQTKNANMSLPPLFVNNHVTDCGTNGFYSEYDGTAQLSAIFLNNRTRDNTSGAINGWDDWASVTGWGHVTTDTGGASTDFTNAGSSDFSLISTAPGKAAGIQPYMDIGALQRQESASTGSGVSRARVVNAN